MATPRFTDHAFVPGSVGDVLRNIRAGDAVSRSSLARTMGLAPSTVSLRIEALARLGFVREDGAEESRGGRKARQLSLDPHAGFVAAAEFGANHVRVVLSDAAGRTLADASSGDGTLALLPKEKGVKATAEALWAEIMRLAEQHGLPESDFLGAAIGIPAPVEHPTGRIVTPSFMPSWHGSDFSAAFAPITDRPVLIENDANLIALGEAAEASPGGGTDLLAVKIGTRIGGGIVLGGHLYRGFGGAAGELAHTAVSGESVVPCTCPVPNCLESVAGGGALVARLRASGFDVNSTSDVVALGSAGAPAATAAIREAGTRIGEVVAFLVNFLNPREVVLAGTMSASTPLVASIKAEIYQHAFPIATDRLEVRATRNPRDGAIIGARTLILDEALAPARVNALADSASAAAGRAGR